MNDLIKRNEAIKAIRDLFLDEDECYAQYIWLSDAIDAITKLPSTCGEWISVTDKKPDRIDEYLVINGGNVMFGIFMNNEWIVPTLKENVTYWMKIPEKPEV